MAVFAGWLRCIGGSFHTVDDSLIFDGKFKQTEHRPRGILPRGRRHILPRLRKRRGCGKLKHSLQPVFIARAWFNGPHAPKQHRQEGREMRSFESREDYLEAILVLQNEKVKRVDMPPEVQFMLTGRNGGDVRARLIPAVSKCLLSR